MSALEVFCATLPQVIYSALPWKSMRKNNPIPYFYPFLAEVIFYFLASISQTSQNPRLLFSTWLKYTGVMGTNNNYFISTGPELDMLGNEEPSSSSWVPELTPPRTWQRSIFFPSAAEMLKSAQALHVPRSPSFQHTFPKSYFRLNWKTSSEKSLQFYLKNHFFHSWKKKKAMDGKDRIPPGQTLHWSNPGAGRGIFPENQATPFSTLAQCYFFWEKGAISTSCKPKDN